MVRISPPPPPVIPQPLFHTLTVGTQLVRIFNPAPPWYIGALTFSHYGPRHRFDHHRFPPPGSPSPYWNDPDRSVYYAGWTLSCCIAECFGDSLLIDQPDFQVALPSLTRPLKLLDLCGNGALRIGSVAALSGTADRSLTQAWSRYFYETPDFGQCDGIRYHSAHNNEPAMVLYERAEPALECPADRIIALSDPWLRPELEAIAMEQGMVILI